MKNSLDVSFVVTAAGNCSFFQKLQNAYQAGAKQVIILSDSGSSDVSIYLSTNWDLI